MENDFGTTVLITDTKADAYLAKARKMKYKTPENRLERWCGGKDGFDDYVERL
tara:strand:+ start:160 stop:318 length:159 start_codon:yes stop_codon:yes gene_type:complete